MLYWFTAEVVCLNIFTTFYRLHHIPKWLQRQCPVHDSGICHFGVVEVRKRSIVCLQYKRPPIEVIVVFLLPRPRPDTSCPQLSNSPRPWSLLLNTPQEKYRQGTPVREPPQSDVRNLSP